MQTCQTCANLKFDKAMSPHGFNGCAKGSKWQFIPARHSCDKWEPADLVKLEKRIAWFKRRGLIKE